MKCDVPNCQAEQQEDNTTCEEHDSVVFVVVLHDRHDDDQILVYVSLAGANNAIAEFQKKCDERYENSAPLTWTERNYGQPDWIRYIDSGEEMPTARIEMTELLE